MLHTFLLLVYQLGILQINASHFAILREQYVIHLIRGSNGINSIQVQRYEFALRYEL